MEHQEQRRVCSEWRGGSIRGHQAGPPSGYRCCGSSLLDTASGTADESCKRGLTLGSWGISQGELELKRGKIWFLLSLSFFPSFMVLRDYVRASDLLPVCLPWQNKIQEKQGGSEEGDVARHSWLCSPLYLCQHPGKAKGTRQPLRVICFPEAYTGL